MHLPYCSDLLLPCIAPFWKPTVHKYASLIKFQMDSHVAGLEGIQGNDQNCSEEKISKIRTRFRIISVEVLVARNPGIAALKHATCKRKMWRGRSAHEEEDVPMQRVSLLFDLFAFLCFSVHMKWWRNGRTSIRFSTCSGNQSDFSTWSESANHSTCAFHRISTSLFKKDLNKFSRWMMRQFHTRTHQRLSSVMAFTLATRGGTANAIRFIVSLQFHSLLLLVVTLFLCPRATDFLSGFKQQIWLSTLVSLVIRGWSLFLCQVSQVWEGSTGHKIWKTLSRLSISPFLRWRVSWRAIQHSEFQNIAPWPRPQSFDASFLTFHFSNLRWRSCSPVKLSEGAIKGSLRTTPASVASCRRMWKTATHGEREQNFYFKRFVELKAWSSGSGKMTSMSASQCTSAGFSEFIAFIQEC